MPEICGGLARRGIMRQNVAGSSELDNKQIIILRGMCVALAGLLFQVQQISLCVCVCVFDVGRQSALFARYGAVKSSINGDNYLIPRLKEIILLAQ